MKYTKLILIVIVLIGSFIRVWQLNKVPASLYWDEMDVGYQASSFLKTGKDYFGNSYPIFFHSFADFRTPLYIYATIPFITILGLNEWSVRLPSALFGILSILLIYLVIRELFKKEKIALISSLVLALSPWAIHYSRIAFEVSLMLFLFLLGLLSFFKSFKNPKWIIISGISFSLCIWTYSIAKLFIPIVLGILIFLYIDRLRKIDKKYLISVLLIFIILLTPIYFSNFFFKGGQRFSEISIFTDPTIGNEINERRLNAALLSGTEKNLGMKTNLIDKIQYNKPQIWLKNFTNNYLTSFSTNFLFIEGDSNLRHSPLNIGQFYKVEALSLLLGLIFLILNFRVFSKDTILLISLLLIAPIPSALTRDGGNHATRLYFLIFPLIAIISLGMSSLFEKNKVLRIFGWVYLIIFFISSLSFLRNYYIFYPAESAKAFEYGFKNVALTTSSSKDKYENIIFDDNETSGMMAYLFNTSYPPDKFHNEINTFQSKVLENIEANKLDNIYFLRPTGRDWKTIIQTKQIHKTLLIVSAKQFQEQDPKKAESDYAGEILDIIYYPNMLPAFYIMKFD